MSIPGKAREKIPLHICNGQAQSRTGLLADSPGRDYPVHRVKIPQSIYRFPCAERWWISFVFPSTKDRYYCWHRTLSKPLKNITLDNAIQEGGGPACLRQLSDLCHSGPSERRDAALTLQIRCSEARRGRYGVRDSLNRVRLMCKNANHGSIRPNSFTVLFRLENGLSVQLTGV